MGRVEETQAQRFLWVALKKLRHNASYGSRCGLVMLESNTLVSDSSKLSTVELTLIKNPDFSAKIVRILADRLANTDKLLGSTLEEFCK
ncbi:hypothetical protein FHG68_19585 [Leptospira weilii]|nr:hypothetical protein [Leptospira weilii]QDK24909.1 hypothetical protein FHG67_19540 [Leptospira weilii]QDK28866.1 hypothetical protein FHG68_19585 [Leptospira weilii]